MTGQADYSAALFACKETQWCCQHITRANLTSWRYKGSVRTRTADESRMGCTHPLLGLPWDVQEQEGGKGTELPLLISEVALHCTAPRGIHGHGAWMPKAGKAWGRRTRVGRWAPTQTGDSPDTPSSSFNLT